MPLPSADYVQRRDSLCFSDTNTIVCVCSNCLGVFFHVSAQLEEDRLFACFSQVIVTLGVDVNF